MASLKVPLSPSEGGNDFDVPKENFSGTPMDSPNPDEADSAAGASASEKEPADVVRKATRAVGLVSSDDFMAQFHKLRLIKQKAAKAAAAGPVRRVVFGDLPEWANISQILLLVHGGAVERAWPEGSEIIVQFVKEEQCVAYHETHSDGIAYQGADGVESKISVTLPEEGLVDNADLSDRVEAGASRVVCLAGLTAAFKADDDLSVMGVLAQDGWKDLKFERILVTQAESGVDVKIFFYDLHDGWRFMEDIKEGTYDCVPSFEVDPCALASSYHFVEEPCPAFEHTCG